MKANELRLGNLVSSYDLLSEITSVNNEGCFIQIIDHTDEHDYTQDVSNNFICPIPLTKEWLLKFGFVANQYNDEFELYPLMFDCEYTDHGEWNISYDGHPLSTEIQHVHQLQNLYFALTGEELTLKS